LGIIGAGAVGMEFADVYNSFGARVTIIEAMDRLLPLEDKDVSPVVEKAYKKRGIETLTAARLERAEVGKESVKLFVKAKDGTLKTIEVERVLVAVGRAPIIDDIGLEAAGVAVERGFIVTNETLQTSVPGIYAIGDVTKPPQWAHKASHEGIAAIEVIAGKQNVHLDYGNMPGVSVERQRAGARNRRHRRFYQSRSRQALQRTDRRAHRRSGRERADRAVCCRASLGDDC
jgi:dihydrolipoamide dehydrogenase